MSSNFTVCLLTKGSRSAPEFLVREVRLRPGQGFSPNSQETILIASGFSSLAPDTDFPLSPTLQLNHDLSRMGSEKLHQLALAEITRKQASSYRSYIIQPDSRLCVIGNSAARLRTFLDNYAGMFEIEPVLLGGYARDFPTAIDCAVYRDRPGYRLEYSLRLPVDSERCAYCGACGPACPEHCLDEHLFLDYSRCTFCGSCESVCAHQAIDVHRLEQRLMHIPALVVLEGTEVELPEDRTAIFREKDLPAYFASQYGCRVDEVVSCDAAICQYSTRLKDGCRICLDVCRHGAISPETTGLVIDGTKCEECGCCVASCPTGALQYLRYNDTSFITYIRDVRIVPGTTVVLGSEKALHQLWWKKPEQDFRQVLFLEFPRIKALSLFHLLFLYASGAGRVVLIGLEDELENGEALQRQVSRACSLLGTFCQAERAVDLLTLPQFLNQPLAEGVFSSLPVFAGALAGNRRVNLAAVLQHLADQSGLQARISDDDTVPFATIFCDEERCTHCYACLNICRIQALSTTGAKLALLWRGALCVGCGLCVRICPEHALLMLGGGTLDAEFFNRVPLSTTRPMTCRRCSKVFGTRKSFERVMTILARKESVDTSHFEYCETCRVVNLFESA